MRSLLLFLLLVPFAAANINTPLNTFPTIAIVTIFIILIYVAAVFSSMKMLGVFAGLCAIMLGLWISLSGIYYQSGFNTVGETTKIVYAMNNSTSTTESLNITKVYNYQQIKFPPISDKGAPIEAGPFLGLIIICLGLYSCLHFGGKIYGKWK